MALTTQDSSEAAINNNSTVVISMKTMQECKAVEEDVVHGTENMNVVDDDDFSDAEDEEEDNCCSRKTSSLRTCLRSSVPACIQGRCGTIIKCSLLVLYLIYFVFSMVLTFGDEGSIRLLAFTVFGGVLLITKVVRKTSSQDTTGLRESLHSMIRKLLYVSTSASIVVFLVLEVGMKEPRNLVSVGGLAFFIVVAFLLSNRPAKVNPSSWCLSCVCVAGQPKFFVNWHTVFWSVALQFMLALFILRTEVGSGSVSWMAERVNNVLKNSRKGSEFMFGKSYRDHNLIFGSFPCIFFINALVAVMYYIGAMQWFVKVIGRFLRWSLDITDRESICVATNILIDYPSTGLAMKPYMELMSRSEIFTVLVAGQASVSGTFIGVVSSFGVEYYTYSLSLRLRVRACMHVCEKSKVDFIISVSYLIPACVMSAPASIAISKLLYPESRPINHKNTCDLGSKKYTSIFEAASIGATSSIHVFGSIVINLYVFYGLLSLINSTLGWFGDRVNVNDLTFEFICSYIFWPLAVIMGADIQDCGNIGKLVGYKLMGSASLAYYQLATMSGNRQVFQDYMESTNGTGTYRHIQDDLYLDGWNKTLQYGYITEKSEAISTYALCGLSNFVSIGICLAVFYTIVPRKQKFVTKKIVLSMFSANLACFMTACFAALFKTMFCLLYSV
ncbi:solute carrier family 28 member 3-like [Haliotis rubra]|uniref:solute carrier family 28 member 3-like n=1 Tax=Haliotis rubra TaxID=36100 RepID=UPI001EE5BAF3|nr:solute carrier family 28 member 3-like [Haliotis rubra]